MSTIPINVCGTVATVPNLRTLPTGRPCASFRLAVNHWKLDKSTGEFVEDGTSWFGVDCYGTLASNVGTSVEQGTTVLVQGHLRNREWASGERTGIAPTVIADHIGPDLRFGTAHYRKSATTRPRPAEPAGDAQATSGWGGLPEPGEAGRPATTDPSGVGAGGEGTVPDAVGEGPDLAGPDGESADGAAGWSPAAVPSETAHGSYAGGEDTDPDETGEDTDTGPEDGQGKDPAIAEATAAAAAPF
ncbi:single-stranded DNA-binding protein [Brevibacterium sp. XM4083]|uniref:single-stranded DNA-binding protein n=1 Tax=Brevibacterium sp. XM4083 TaxID=2583238 RepID=UPI001125FCC7|nr:single-stranded DNA-binding protein [Brevibacterium sp. XM4083]MCM1012190.1 single-stranded DNA-binding protein [Brevibacterium sp. XM4083]